MTTTLELPTSKFKALTRLVGNTPLVSIHFRYRGTHRVLFAKSEYLNLTGSIKDRMAVRILQKAYADGKISPGHTIAEATSGNTGISFAAIGRMLGHPVKIFMPDWMSQERVHLIRSYGAEVVSVSKSDGGFLGSIRMCEEFAASRNDVFLPRQFSNPANCEAHEETTGPEIWSQLLSVGKRPNAFVAGVGTGGTVMGVGKYLRQRRILPSLFTRSNPPSRLLSRPAAKSATTASRASPTNSFRKLSSSRNSTKSSAFPMATRFRWLRSSPPLSALPWASLPVAISSRRSKRRKNSAPVRCVATVFCDDNKKYLSTALMNDEPAKPDDLSPQIELLGLGTVGRACEFCH